MRKIRVLVITNGYPTRIHPDYTPWMVPIVRALEEAGMDVEVEALVPPFILNKQAFAFKLAVWLKYLALYQRLLLKDYSQYDIVYVHFYLYLCFPLLLRRKSIKSLVIHWHGTELLGLLRFSERVLSSISSFVIPSQAYHVVACEYMVERVQKRFGTTKVWVIPNGGVDTSIFKPDRHHRPNTDSASIAEINIGFAGAVSQQKGFELFARLVEDYNAGSFKVYAPNGGLVNLKFHFIKYRVEKSLSHLVDKLTKYDNVIAHPPMPNHKLPAFYNRLDILVFPIDVSKSEGLGTVPLEAMACGVPVVAPKGLELPYYVIPGVSGELYENMNYEQFKEAVCRVVAQIDRYRPERIVLERYSKEAAVNKYRQVFLAIARES